jgi:hypothetical protein
LSGGIPPLKSINGIATIYIPHLKKRSANGGGRCVEDVSKIVPRDCPIGLQLRAQTGIPVAGLAPKADE